MTLCALIVDIEDNVNSFYSKKKSLLIISSKDPLYNGIYDRPAPM